MKRVLIFSFSYLPHVGGAEIALKEITDRLSKDEFEFHLITQNFGNDKTEERLGNIFIHRIGRGTSPISKYRFLARAAKRAYQLHQEKPFDLLWAMMAYMLVPIVHLQKRGIKIPYVLTLQEGDTYEHVFHRLSVLPIQRYLARGFHNASGIQAISTFLATWPKQQGFEGEVAVIPNGVDMQKFSVRHSQEAINAKRKELSRPETKTLLVTASRLVDKNAVDDIIRALTLLPKSVDLVVCGTGEKASWLRYLAENLGVKERVHFCGTIAHDELPLILQSCDIFIRPSRSEGMGNSFIEAMAAGIPVIGTREGGIRDFLFDTKVAGQLPTGFVVGKNNPGDIAHEVEYLISHLDTAHERIESAKTFITGRYEWNSIAAQMKEFLTTAINKKVDK